MIHDRARLGRTAAAAPKQNLRRWERVSRESRRSA
jgi:hypothetical protein